MSHGYHEGLPGYTPQQILHAGCAECEARAREHSHGLAHLDQHRFAYAWQRAAQWRSGTGNLPDLDQAEIPLLEMLWSVQIQLERFGIPIGMLPMSPVAGQDIRRLLVEDGQI